MTQDTLEGFLEKLASRSPTPGGGSASSLVGAVAAALCSMVGRLNDKATGEAGVLHETIEPADQLRGRLTALMTEDIRCFTELMRAWKLPETDPDKPRIKLAATVAATESPLAIMAAALEVMKLARTGLEKSKKNCLSDAAVAGLLGHAALEGARLNVMINLPGLSDETKRAELANRAEALRQQASALRVTIDRLIAENYG